MTGIELIAKEREEQFTKHNRTVIDDLMFNDQGDLINAAASVLLRCNAYYPKNWNEDIRNKMVNKPYTERLAIAGALIAAEIDRYNYEQTLKLDYENEFKSL